MPKYKFNLIDCLIDRAHKICSNRENFLREVEKLKKYFFQNGFPFRTIETQFSKRLESLSKPQENIQTACKKTIFAVLPYISKSSNKALNSDISEICKRFYPQLDVKIIFKNKFSVSSFFNFKDKVPTLVQSDLVYEYSCGQCDARYIGETSRHLKTRLAEHKGLSNRTGKPLLNPPHSSIRDHALSTGHDISSDNFKVI